MTLDHAHDGWLIKLKRMAFIAWLDTCIQRRAGETLPMASASLKHGRPDMNLGGICWKPERRNEADGMVEVLIAWPPRVVDFDRPPATYQAMMLEGILCEVSASCV